MIEKFDSPESSNIEGAEWESDTAELTVRFKGMHGATSTYKYPGFSAAEWTAFRNSRSKGVYFFTSIRSQYKGVKQ